MTTETKKVKSIIAVDLETTGLDPKTGTILEVSMHHLDSELNILSSFEGTLFQPSVESLDPFIIDMHTKSGLLGLPATTDLGLIAEWLSQFEGITLLGSSVGFDKAWLLEHLNWYSNDLSWNHQVIDVSSLRLIHDLIGERGEVAHRAHDDIMWSIGVARKYRDAIVPKVSPLLSK